MLSKNESKYIQSLALKKGREGEGLFVAEGPKIVAELLQAAPHRIQRLYATAEWIDKNKALPASLPVQAITGYELEKISQLQTPNEVVALVKQFESIIPQNFSWAVYLDGVQDPGNFGTIIRICDWFGVQHIVCSPGCADRYNPKVVQSTMASIARVNVFYDETESWLQQQHIPLFAAALDGESLYKMSRVEKGILLIGNESKGLRPELLGRAHKKITIPRQGGAESLNAAVATGIILSHLAS
jgi:TrmH family RNA methyltransferase